MAELASHYEAILRLIGEDPQREGLLKTPVRAAKAMLDLTAGYHLDANELMQKAIFSHTGSSMVIVRDIEFYSLCEHHILPFFGRVTVGYIPDGKIVGLSKLPRVVDAFARRLQVQETSPHRSAAPCGRHTHQRRHSGMHCRTPLHEDAWRGETAVRNHHN